jgi:hypothetical protein
MHPQTYVRSLWKTISESEYYIDVLNAPMWFSVRFFLISLGILGLLSGAWRAAYEVPRWRQSLEGDLYQVVEQYPADRVVRWETSTGLATTPTEPLVVPYPSLWTLPKPYKTFGVVAPNITNQDQIAAAAPESSWWIVGQQELFLRSARDTSWQTFPLKDLPGFENSFVLTKDALTSAQPEIRTTLDETALLLQWLAVLGGPAWLIVTTSLALVSHVLLAIFFFWAFGYLLGPLKTLQISLHIAVVAQILQSVADVLTPTSHLPLFTITFWIYLFILSWTLQHVHQAHSPLTPPPESE